VSVHVGKSKSGSCQLPGVACCEETPIPAVEVPGCVCATPGMVWECLCSGFSPDLSSPGPMGIDRQPHQPCLCARHRACLWP